MVPRGSFWKPVLIAASVAIFIGVLGGTLTDTGPWYQNLRKAPWQPPDWLFGPAWTLIFALTADGFSHFLIGEVAERLRGELLSVPDVAKIDLIGAHGPQ